MAHTTSRWIFVFSVFVAAASRCGQAAEPLVRPKITISKETTYVLGPVRPDGYIDYAAAINDLCGRGVTPEDNAAVPIWQAIGPAELPQDVRDRFFKLLGIRKLPDKGDYLVDFADYLERVRGQVALGSEGPDGEQWEERCYEQFDKAEKAPWSQEQYPVIAGWLKANEKPLQVIVEGVRRPRLYSPVVSDDDDDSLISVLVPHLTASREVARLLTIRAMLRLQSGQVQKAWEDVLACHRLARLIGQGPYIIDLLIGVAVEGIAHNGDVALAHYGELSADQAHKFQAGLQELPPLSRAVGKLNSGERLFSLAFLSRMARGGTKDSEDAFFFAENGDYAAVSRLAAHPRVDWDVILRKANNLSDQVVQAHNQPNRSQRNQALDKLTSLLKAAGRPARDSEALSKALADDASSEMVTRHLSGILFDDTCSYAVMSGNPEDLATTRLRLSQLAFALAAYLSDHAHYPRSVSELSPKYIGEVPKDVFADGEFRYQQRGQGYLLYSVGINQTDEGGRSSLDTVGTDEHDDLESETDDVAVRTPTDAK